MPRTPRTEAGAQTPDRWTVLLVLVVSATILAHEVALLRVLAIAHWHHAAQLVIAVALCGFGAAATLLTLAPKLRSLRWASRSAAAYAVSIPLTLSVASHIEFNALAVGWEPTQWLRLLALQCVFVFSLLLGALCVQIGLACSGQAVGRVYAANLAGSGFGALAVLPLLALGPPEQVLGWIALMPALLAIPRARPFALAAIIVVVLLPTSHIAMTDYKALSLARLLPESQIVETRYRPHARIDLVNAPSLRPLDGLSLQSRAEIPALTLITVDGSAAGTIVDGDAPFFDDMLQAAPLALLDPTRVLVLGAAGNLHEAALGPERVRRVDAVWSGENPRSVLARQDERFDVVWITLSRSVAMSENPLATQEAFAAALSATSERGVVFVSVPVSTPPREELKAIRTAKAATPHVEAVRSLDVLGLMLRRAPFSERERESLADFCRDRGFDLIGEHERTHESGHRDYLTALSDGAVATRYRDDVATDDAPYFHRFMPWRRLWLDLAATGRLEAAHVDWGTLITLVATVQVTALGVLLLAMPLVVVARKRAPTPERRFAALHFLAIGVAYAALEMAFIGRLTLVLGHPEYAFGIVVCVFLLASGVGALSGARVRTGAWIAAALALVAIAVLDHVRSIPVAIGLAALVALPMGIPFPAGLRRLDARAPSLVPWALAANGCASVATFSATPLLVSDIGFSGLIGSAALIYLLVGLADRQRDGQSIIK